MTESAGQKIVRDPRISTAAGVTRVMLAEQLAALIDSELAAERDAWVSVKERTPDMRKSVLAFVPKMIGQQMILWREATSQTWLWTDGEYTYHQNDVTHWLELPAPPACGS